jgi:hypothetical protein
VTPCSRVEIFRRFGKTSCCTKERVASIFRGLLSKFSSTFYQNTRCYISHKMGSVSCINYHSLGKVDKEKFVYKFVQSPPSSVDVKNQRSCTFTPPCGFTASTVTNLRCTVADLARDSVVGKEIRYRIEGPGIELRWTRDFLHPSRPAFGPTQPPIQRVPDHSREYSGTGVALTTYPLPAPRLTKL